MSQLCQGRIVWVVIDDPQGRNPKRRPALVVTRTDDLAEATHVKVVGITTREDLAPEAARTELQYDPTGRCRSGLRERSWAVSIWVKTVPVTAIESLGGVVPGLQLAEVLRKIEAVDTD